MEKALILITLKLGSSSNLLEQITAIPSVTDAEMVYGPYDAYVVLEAETKEELRDSVMKIRQVYGVHATLTCNVIP